MKKVLVIIAILILPLAGFAQRTDTAAISNTELIEVKKVDDLASKKATSIYKAKLIKINHKKSNDIISIKAYRKSLHVKVSTKKLC